MIILGDVGVNYNGGFSDGKLKYSISQIPITLFCVHGNHEARPSTIKSYHEQYWHNGIVYVEDKYPNLLFAKDGEIFNLNGLKTIVIGGAYSIDKEERIENGWKWWADEQPSKEIKKYVTKQLCANGWCVDVVLSHTAPLKYEPSETFSSYVDQNKVDKSTEQWLDEIENKLRYQKWYCGHYHIDKEIDKIVMMFETIKHL